MTQLLIRLFIRDPDDTRDPAVRTAYGNLASLVGMACNLLLCILAHSFNFLSSFCLHCLYLCICSFLYRCYFLCCCMLNCFHSSVCFLLNRLHLILSSFLCLIHILYCLNLSIRHIL